MGVWHPAPWCVMRMLILQAIRPCVSVRVWPRKTSHEWMLISKPSRHEADVVLRNIGRPGQRHKARVQQEDHV